MMSPNFKVLQIWNYQIILISQLRIQLEFFSIFSAHEKPRNKEY